MLKNPCLPEGSLISSPENREYLASPDGLERALREQPTLEGIAVRCSSDLSLTVELGGRLGIIPREEAVFEPDGSSKDIAVITRVGKPVCFKLLRLGENGELILSRRRAQLEAFEERISRLRPGDIVTAKVTHLEHFGAFVDIDCGLVALLSIDRISVSRISHPKDRLSVGMLLPVVISSLEPRGDDNSTPARIFVSRRELLGTWEENAALFEAGQTVTGTVRSIEPYGIFIELTPNLSGLAEYRADLTVGQTAAVYIKSLIPERMKVKLVVVDPYRGLSVPEPPRRFIPEEVKHIPSWRYSPDSCARVIESVFDREKTAERT